MIKMNDYVIAYLRLYDITSKTHFSRMAGAWQFPSRFSLPLQGRLREKQGALVPNPGREVRLGEDVGPTHPPSMRRPQGLSHPTPKERADLGVV